MGAGVAKGASGGGGRRGRRRRAAPMADINVTPFIDVMLVLLIIFMSIGFVWTTLTQTLMQIHFPSLRAIKNLSNLATMVTQPHFKL